MDRLNEARTAYNEAVERMNAAADAAAEAADTEIEATTAAFDEAEVDVLRRKSEVERLTHIAEARSGHTALDVADVIEHQTTPEVRAAIKAEPTTYHRGSTRSWFADLADFQTRGSEGARSRLVRNQQEMETELRNAPETRAVNSTDTTGGDFVPPIYIMDDFAAMARAHRVFADTVSHLTLPPMGDSVNLPAVNTGTVTAVQADGGSVQSTDIATKTITANVQTIAGQNDVSRQALERSAPGLDAVILQDLARDYAIQVDKQCLNGSATNAKGALQDSNRISLTFTSGSPTLPLLWPFFAQGNSQISSQRYLPPTAIFMHPRRWFWMTGQLDSSTRPFVIPTAQGPYNALGFTENVVAERVAGQIGGIPVLLDPNIPTTNGASTNQDPVLISRVEDNYLYEDAASPRQFRFEGVLSANNQIRLQVVGYMAFLIRYSKSNASVDGTGLAAPAGY